MNFIYFGISILYIRKKWYRVLIGILLIFAFEIVSLITKNIGSVNLNNEPSLITIILQLDTLIMAMLYYLYANRKER